MNKKDELTKRKVTKVHSIPDEKELNKHKHLYDLLAKRVNSDYQYTPSLQNAITDMIYYFNGIEHNLDLEKGLGVIGPKGTGKTLMMYIFTLYMQAIKNPHPNMYRNVSYEELKDHAKSNNNLEYYGYNVGSNMWGIHISSRPFRLCVNEAFSSYNEMNYGTSMKEIFNSFWMVRYELFQRHSILTHFTSNLDPDDLNEELNPILFDRIKEMYNLIVIDEDSFRK